MENELIKSKQVKSPAKPAAKARKKLAVVEPVGLTLKAGEQLSIVIPYPTVSGNHSTRHGRYGSYKSVKAKDYKLAVQKAVLAAKMKLNLTGPMDLYLDAIPPDNRARDADNLLKEVGDALTRAGFWQDDSNKVIKKTTIDWLPSDKTTGSAVLIRVVGRDA